MAPVSMLSIELVPRDLEVMVSEADEVRRRFDQFQWLNIPDIKKLSVRSHEAALAAAHLPFRVIPHIRARDRSPAETVDILRRLVDGGVNDALIVTGDRIEQDPDAEHPTALDVIEEAAKSDISIGLWAALDPYRGELRAELEYARAKVEAGACGLFTQPFFDVRLAEMCLEQLDGTDTFVGISPVTSEKSCRYWERTNRVVFPVDFEATLDYCSRLTAELIELTRSFNQHAYLMPIRVDPIEYLTQAFGILESASSVPS